MEITRFGPGQRRTRPLPGTQGLADQTIWSDPRARITELAFSAHAVIAPQISPDLGIFIVVAGGGWVQVGDERASINHGEAVEWPPGVAHGAWTDGTNMRAILVEVPDATIEAPHRRAGDASGDIEPARGRLAAREIRPEEHDSEEGEPW